MSRESVRASRMGFPYSVEALPSPESAALKVCQGREAHFTRTGNSETPENTDSLPSSGAAFSRAREGSLVTRRWKRSKRASASERVLPRRASVIIEADAVEMEQPAPLKLTSRTTSPSSWTKTVALSPQRGLKPSAREVAEAISRKVRGR